jgi:hypothetical protein
MDSHCLFNLKNLLRDMGSHCSFKLRDLSGRHGQPLFLQVWRAVREIWAATVPSGLENWLRIMGSHCSFKVRELTGRHG